MAYTMLAVLLISSVLSLTGVHAQCKLVLFYDSCCWTHCLFPLADSFFAVPIAIGSVMGILFLCFFAVIVTVICCVFCGAAKTFSGPGRNLTNIPPPPPPGGQGYGPPPPQPSTGGYGAPYPAAELQQPPPPSYGFDASAYPPPPPPSSTAYPPPQQPYPATSYSDPPPYPAEKFWYRQ